MDAPDDPMGTIGDYFRRALALMDAGADVVDAMARAYRGPAIQRGVDARYQNALADLRSACQSCGAVTSYDLYVSNKRRCRDALMRLAEQP